MSDLIGDILEAALGALFGTTFAYVFWIRKRLIELRHGHDTWLKEARYQAYRALWKVLEPLALSAPDKDFDHEILGALGGELRTAYFDNGLLLTARARDVYLLLQASIERAQEIPGTIRARRARITSDDLEELRKQLPKLGAEQLTHGSLFEHWFTALKSAAKDWQLGPEVTVQSDGAAPLPARVPSVVPRATPIPLPVKASQPPQKLAKATPGGTFVLLQSLASSLRTIMTADLNSRDNPVLRPSASCD